MAMTLGEAADVIGAMLDAEMHGRPAPPNGRNGEALVRAKQALDILDILQRGLRPHETVQIKYSHRGNETVWAAERDYRTHLGSDLVDSFAQLCQTLSSERSE